eukprot:COSAG01_NODE_984_length_12344_cov_215.085362_16_plen_46_part_00
MSALIRGRGLALRVAVVVAAGLSRPMEQNFPPVKVRPGDLPKTEE